MRIVRAQVSNFGSYKTLQFYFLANGLTLISGPTGAGKSTFMDIVPWILFGRTAKNGAADDVKSWDTNEDTIGTIYMEDGFEVTRIRGKKNDLYFGHNVAKSYERGKDLNDTQKLINNHLGLDAELYLSGAYFHEFSQTSQFFTTSAKIRRQITEQMADLRIAKDLTANMTHYKKAVKKAKEQLDKDIAVKENSIQYLTKALNTEIHNKKAWFDSKNANVKFLSQKTDTFAEDRQARLDKIVLEHNNKRIEMEYDAQSLQDTVLADSHYQDRKNVLEATLATFGDAHCSACGAPSNIQQRMVVQKHLHTLEADRASNERTKTAITQLQTRLAKHQLTLAPLLAAEENRPNPYVDQLKSLKNETNPHTPQVSILQKQLEDAEEGLKDAVAQNRALAIELADLDLLSDLNDVFRTQCLKNTIQGLETCTNKLLTDHFDAELRVKFDIEQADKLEVLITKDGNSCSYHQLSKGQRQLLKLCFGVSVMQSVANHHGIRFSSVFMDEALDGLDDTLKIKAFGLLNQLSTQYDNIFVIDHAEALKTMFLCRYDVSIDTNGQSTFEKS